MGDRISLDMGDRKISESTAGLKTKGELKITHNNGAPWWPLSLYSLIIGNNSNLLVLTPAMCVTCERNCAYGISIQYYATGRGLWGVLFCPGLAIMNYSGSKSFSYQWVRKLSYMAMTITMK